MTNSVKKILSSGPIDDVAAETLAPFGEIVIAPDKSERTLLGMLDGVIGLIVRGDASASAQLIDNAKDLKVIGRTGVGYENVDISAATRRGIPVVYTPGASARAIAEAAFAYMLTMAKNIPFWNAQLKCGNWGSRYEQRPMDLTGQTLGIVGLGNSGRILAQLARPFNMTLLAFDPYVDQALAQDLQVELVSLDNLLNRSRFISLHVPLNEQTQGMINRENLRSMQHGAYLINLARGKLIESLDVLYEALTDGTLAGVGLDVFEPEPPDVNHPIFKLDNCLASPHALCMTDIAMARIFKSMSEDMAAVLSGRTPKHVVNPETID